MKEFYCRHIKANITIGGDENEAVNCDTDCPFAFKCRQDEFCEHLDILSAQGRGRNSSGQSNRVMRGKRC